MSGHGHFSEGWGLPGGHRWGLSHGHGHAYSSTDWWTSHGLQQLRSVTFVGRRHQQARVDHLVALIFSGRRLPGCRRAPAGQVHDTDPTLAMVLPAGVEELTVHADARH